TVIVQANDLANNSTILQIPITVDGAPPTVAITSPAVLSFDIAISSLAAINGTASDDVALGDHLNLWILDISSGAYWNDETSSFDSRAPTPITIALSSSSSIEESAGPARSSSWSYTARSGLDFDSYLRAGALYVAMAQAADSAGNVSEVTSSTFSFGSIS